MRANQAAFGVKLHRQYFIDRVCKKSTASGERVYRLREDGDTLARWVSSRRQTGRQQRRVINYDQK